MLKRNHSAIFNKQNMAQFQILFKQTTPHHISFKMNNYFKNRIYASTNNDSTNKKLSYLYSVEYFEGQIEEYIGDNISGEWHQINAKICNNTLYLHLRYLTIKNLAKIKCLSQESFKNCRRIKLVKSEGEQIFISADMTKIFVDLPYHYIWFAKLINLKLIDLGINKSSKFDNGNRIQPNAYIGGIVYKRSQYLGEWKQRYIVINNKGLFSYKNRQGEHSFHISVDSILYMWTRFEFYQQHLIIKIKHGLRKTQLALPIMNYCQKNDQNWLYWLYHMLMQKHNANE